MICSLATRAEVPPLVTKHWSGVHEATTIERMKIYTIEYQDEYLSDMWGSDFLIAVESTRPASRLYPALALRLASSPTPLQLMHPSALVLA
jgi:hypothetical protein